MEDVTQAIQPSISRQTKMITLFGAIIHEPVAALYVWLPFILRKDLMATVLQVTLLVMLKSVLSLCVFYGEQYFKKNLRLSFLISGALARLPFLFFPFTSSIGYFIFAATMYVLFHQAASSLFGDVLKVNLGKKERQKYFNISSILSYVEGTLLALYLSHFLDQHAAMWRLLFSLFGAIGILGVFIQGMLPFQQSLVSIKAVGFTKPWKEAWTLMREEAAFAHFQWGFMIAGFGIMLVVVIAPLYFVDTLQLSHFDFASARYVFMGFGFILCTPFWKRVMKRFSLFQTLSLIFICFAIFPLTLVLAKTSLSVLYSAYVVYGLAQSGSHLLWHSSSFQFDEAKDPIILKGVNHIMVGIRGVIAPVLGGILYTQVGSLCTLLIGMSFCLFGSWFMLFKQPTYQVAELKTL